ncbi:MAG: maturation protein [Fushun levivirus 6]|nr:MAG: maturation protein [Fushun levivirus 6]
MAKRKYRLRRSGILRTPVLIKERSVWRDRDGNMQNQEKSILEFVPVEDATIYLGKGRWVLKTHPAGFLYRWRLPSAYTRGHQVIDLTDGTSQLTWDSPQTGTSGTGTRTGPTVQNLLNRGDWSQFIESRLDMRPTFTYNEQAQHNVALRLKVKDAKVNLSVFAAEFKKTVTGLAKNFHDIVGVYRAVRRGNFSKAASFIKPRASHKGFSSRDVAGRWLELQYAIKPLVGDLQTGYDYIRENIETLMTYSVSHNFKTTVPLHSINSDSWHSMSASGTRGVRTKVYYVIDNARLREAAKLGMINPLVVAWELVPYSFVVDWLLPVGNMLEALDATVGTQFVSGTQTRWCDIDLVGETRESYTSYHDWPSTDMTPLPFTGKIYSISREALTSYPIVLPYVKNPFSTGHLINAVALVRNLFKR